MSTPFFPDVDTIRYEGLDSDNPLAFRWYDADRVVAGRTMAEHLRFAVCYWHSFNWDGFDIFGAARSTDRGCRPSTRRWIRWSPPVQKMDAAFEFVSEARRAVLLLPRPRRRPRGGDVRRVVPQPRRGGRLAGEHQERTGVKLLWGTANLFSNPRFQAGAATNPDPELFAFAAAPDRALHGGDAPTGRSNYVLWGGREGYETLLNTDMPREIDQLGRFFHMAVEHKKIGFEGSS